MKFVRVSIVFHSLKPYRTVKLFDFRRHNSVRWLRLARPVERSALEAVSQFDSHSR